MYGAMLEATSPRTLPENRWDLYRVLAEPVRLRLLALAGEEELAIGELAELLAESQPNVSRHTAPLKQVGLVSMRRQGTRTLIRLREEAAQDPVVADALASGRALCERDGSLRRVADVLRARDALGREFFAQPARGPAVDDSPNELGAYLAALAPLLARRDLAVDVGTGDGALLDVLAPTFHHVIGIDRSETQLSRARARVHARGYENVTLVEADVVSPQKGEGEGKAKAKEPTSRRVLGKARERGADAVFAARVLHHAAKPASAVAALGALVAPGGALVVLDYARHDDESMRDVADLWLGFEATELKKFARSAGFSSCEVNAIPAALVFGGGGKRGPDHHLPWQVMVAKK